MPDNATMLKAPVESKTSKPEQSGEFKLGYVPALDGLRAVSVLMVLSCHDIGPVTSIYGRAFNCWVSINVFFIVSGFLISSILLKEAKKNNGNFDLKKFYMRRWLRIAPVYYAFLGIVMAWNIWGGNHHLKPFAAAALYLTNLDSAFQWNLIPARLGLSHLWSLGMEEQFYLFWPASLRIFKQHATKFVVATIAAVYCWRLYLVSHGAPWYRLVDGFDTYIDTILVGVLTALLLFRPKVNQLAQKLLGHGIVQAAFAVAIFYALQQLGHPMYGGLNDQIFFWAVKLPIVNLLIALFLVSVVSNQKGFVSGILSNFALVFIGKISYSIYLWHPFIHSVYCAFYWDYFCKHGPTAEAIQYAIIFVCATISYYTIEEPFLKLKSKFN